MTSKNDHNEKSLTRSELAELNQLIAASSDRALEPCENERLEQLLKSSREARSIFTSYMQLDAGLDWKIRGCPSLESVVERSRKAASCLAELDELSQAVRPKLARMRMLSLLALAASVMFVVATIAWFSTNPRDEGNGALAAVDADAAHADASAAEKQIVANVVQLSKECSWFVENRSSKSAAVRPGDTVRLTRGQLRMDFDCGATVTMRSPAALEIISPTRTRAVLGTLKAHVGKGAEGFTVETPRTTVVDLGTDFGIDVSRHGSTDVVVFNGAVDLHSDGINGLAARQRLTAGEGVRVSGEGTASRIVSILDSQFSMADIRRGRDRIPVISEVRDNILRGKSWNYYEVVHGGMSEDAKAFVDREHEWNGLYAGGMPHYLLGADYVKTFNDDKLNREVEIRVTLARPSILYVLLDKRSPVPDWLRRRFFNTGDEIGLDGGKYSRFGERKNIAAGAGTSIDDVFSVWRLDVPAADTVTLGAIQAGGETHNMYGIAAVPMETHRSRDDVGSFAGNPTKKWSRLSTDAQGILSSDGEIERSKDIDVFRFDWRGGVAEVACHTNGFTTLDPVVSVYDASDSLVGYARAPRIGRGRTAVKMNLPEGTYYVAVTGSDEVGEVGGYHVQVSPASANLPAPLRASPKLALQATPIKTGVELSWSDIPTAKSYIVEKSTDAVTYQTLASTASTRISDKSDPGQLGIYRVRAETADGPVSAPRLIATPSAAATRVQTFGSSPRSSATVAIGSSGPPTGDRSPRSGPRPKTPVDSATPPFHPTDATRIVSPRSIHPHRKRYPNLYRRCLVSPISLPSRSAMKESH
jgi:FecR protein